MTDTDTALPRVRVALIKWIEAFLDEHPDISSRRLGIAVGDNNAVSRIRRGRSTMSRLEDIEAFMNAVRSGLVTAETLPAGVHELRARIAAAAAQS